MKTCRLCKEDKYLDCFYKHKNTKDRLRNECIPCVNKKTMQYYLDNKEHMVEKRKEYHFQSKYGLSMDDLNRMKERQNNLCKICKEEAPLVVDHDHETGKVRGMLCSRCNLAVAYLEANPGWADKAIQYLEKYQTH